MILNRAIFKNRCIGHLCIFGSDAMGSRTILEICVHFAGFVDGITIFTFVFLSVLSCLYLIENCLFFLLGDTIENNKINYKDNSKIKTVARR